MSKIHTPSLHVSEFSFILQPATDPSHGYGVFALRDIDPFEDLTNQLFPNGYGNTIRDEDDFPPEYIKYCVGRPDGKWITPEKFNAMDIGWYLNHSFEPNVLHGDVEGPDGRPIGHTRFAAAAGGVAAGTELLIDYSELDEPPEVQKPYYMRPDITQSA